jgi:hypothetical protein
VAARRHLRACPVDQWQHVLWCQQADAALAAPPAEAGPSFSGRLAGRLSLNLGGLAVGGRVGSAQQAGQVAQWAARTTSLRTSYAPSWFRCQRQRRAPQRHELVWEILQSTERLLPGRQYCSGSRRNSAALILKPSTVGARGSVGYDVRLQPQETRRRTWFDPASRQGPARRRRGKTDCHRSPV